MQSSQPWPMPPTTVPPGELKKGCRVSSRTFDWGWRLAFHGCTMLYIKGSAGIMYHHPVSGDQNHRRSSMNHTIHSVTARLMEKNIYECKYPWNYSSFKSCDHWLQQFGLVTFCPNPNPLTASRLAVATNAMYQRPCGGFPTIQMLQILEVKRFFFWTVRPRDLCFRGLVRRSIIQLASVVTDNFYTTGVIMGYPMCGVSSTACCHVLQPWYNPWYYPWYNQLWGYLMLP